MKNSILKDFGSLFYMEMLKLKNKVIDSFQNPLATVKALMRIIFPLILIIFSIYIKITNSNKPVSKINSNFSIDVVGAVLIVLICLIVLLNLNSAAEKYNPTDFSAADVNYLFPSPISPRVIYAFTIIKKSFLSVIIGIFSLIYIFVFGASYINIYGGKIIFVFVGFFLMSLIMKSTIFLMYSLSTRFNIGNYLKIIVRGLSILIVGDFLFSLRGATNVFNKAIEVLNDSFFSSIPVISWAKEVFMAPIVPNTPILQTIALLLTALISFFLAIYLATNYYEEASLGAEYFTKLKLARNKKEDLQNVIEEHNGKKKKQRIDVKINRDFKGAWSFIWKQAIIEKRKNGNVFFSVKMLLPLAASLGIGYIFKDKGLGDIVALYCSGFFGIVMIAPTILSPLKLELRSIYIYLLPGRARDKIISVYSITAIKSILYCLIATIPVCVFARQISILNMLIISLAMTGTLFLVFLGVLIITLILPTYDDGKNLIFVYIIDLILLLPAAIVTILTGIFITKSTQYILLTYSGTIIIIIVLLVLLSDWLFSKIELK